jgi:hypothetical protein
MSGIRFFPAVLLLLFLTIGCTDGDSAEMSAIAPEDALSYLEEAFDGVESDEFAPKWEREITARPVVDSLVDHRSDSCDQYADLQSRARDVLVSGLVADGALELRRRTATSFGVVIVTVTVHRTVAAADEYATAFIAARSDDSNPRCIEESSATPSFSLRLAERKLSLSSPQDGASFALIATRNNGDNTLIEGYSWSRANVSVLVLISADETRYEDLDVEEGLTRVDKAVVAASR